MLFVDIMDIIISPFSWKTYIRLVYNFIELAFSTNQSAKD